MYFDTARPLADIEQRTLVAESSDVGISSVTVCRDLGSWLERQLGTERDRSAWTASPCAPSLARRRSSSVLRHDGRVQRAPSACHLLLQRLPLSDVHSTA